VRGETAVHDALQNLFDIRQNVMIPETQHLEPLLLQPLAPFIVSFYEFSMLATISFNNKLFLVANKIDDIPADLLLSSELHSI